ncbi:archaetidylserine decarboxylase [Alkalicoccus halolimnae]|uniref:phosphatidylserine decarboxylase n=1 Tax=Alkalicoccus halolimnae TaxID=1667239 RepID=A0A5C7FM51_9BACI|nr:archaetidylserine decarboxylase [Alkalicoccus halolimnae]TXF86476.1 phosphatidylserine decarboxylase [Alkalicoccus halolimnae]
MKKETYRLIMDLTHNPFYTSVLKGFASSCWSKPFIRRFSNTYGINIAEAGKPIEEYKTLQEFFSRSLKENSRPVSPVKNSVVSPVDGYLTAAGNIEAQDTFTVKGKVHDLYTLLRREDKVNRYSGGTFGVFYLSPQDYHRIHSPLDGKVISRWALGEYSEPVNSLAFKFGVQPLASNYRLITEISTAFGYVCIVKVGALNVNSVYYTHLNSQVEKGEEFAGFSFGSSVIVLFEPGRIALNKEEGAFLRQGEVFGLTADRGEKSD